MGKCNRCGRRGLFVKCDRITGLCRVCEYETAAAEAEEKAKKSGDLLEEAKKAAQTQAQIDLERQTSELRQRSAQCNAEVAALTAERDALAEELATLQSSITSIVSKTTKLKPLAKSINAALMAVAKGDTVRAFENIDELIPEIDLNCLSVKELSAKYRNVRKQIINVCNAYESNYQTKTIRALYKLMVLGLEAEFENVLYTMRYGTLEKAIANIRSLTTKYYTVAIDGNQIIVPTLKRFIAQIESLYLEAVNIEYEYYIQRERAKEEQRAIKEKMRQEVEERKRLEREREKVDAEEEKYRLEITRIRDKMKAAHDSELEVLRTRIAEIERLVEKVEERRAEIVNLQNGKAGTVYIISNVGSFGEHVFKIGMTRRIEPQDRIDELGNASVPFPFDVHSFIFSEDAVSLETALHNELNDRRINKVNLRKEFFDVTIEELKSIVSRIDPTAPFKETALAEQYRQSQSIQYIPANPLIDDSE